jgi:hypothetical protein
MLDLTVKDLPQQQLQELINNIFEWIKKEVPDTSYQNNLNFTKKYTTWKSYSNPDTLQVKWAYKTKSLWRQGDFYGLMDYTSNTILLYCKSSYTMKEVLGTLLHEYCHSQQPRQLYHYLKVDYWNHPMERQADEFADLYLKKYSELQGWKFEEESVS